MNIYSYMQTKNVYCLNPLLYLFAAKGYFNLGMIPV